MEDPAAPEDLRSLAETAAFFQVSQPTLKRWLEAGAPVFAGGSNGVAYQLSLRAVAEWRAGRREAETEAEQRRAEQESQLRLELLGGEALTAGDAGAEALTPRQRADALQAEVAKTKLAQLRRELVPAEDMALRLGELLAALKTRLRQIPDTAGPELGLSEPQAARLAELVDEALNDAADAAERVMAEAAG